jgi:outer membrane receptor protein involved in Fe transport|tara:strand:+ start:26529 stop:28820 length:2292 start_codon:yes stop_codon:yes gene_type:complete
LKLKKFGRVLTGQFILCSLISFVHADDNGDLAGNAEKRKPNRQLEEILVTATKRDESLREIPASITAFTGEDLERQGAQTMGDIIKLIPGVNITKTDFGTAARVTVRGISSQDGTNLTTSVLFGDVNFVDNYAPRVLPDPLPFDLRTVEVLKGPQGTLFGAGSLNGMVRYVPEPAEFDLFTLKYFGEYTKVNEGGGAPIFGAVANLPWGENLALRILAFDRRSPGYIDDTQNNVEDVNTLEQDGMRALLAWKPTDRGHLGLMYAKQATYNDDSAVANNTTGELSHSDRPRPSPSHSEYELYDLKIDYDFNSFSFVSDSSYLYKYSTSRNDVSVNLDPTDEGTLPLLELLEPGTESKSYSQEFRLVSNDDESSRFDWIVGITGSQQRIDGGTDYGIGEENSSQSAVTSLVEQLLPGAGGLVTDDGRLSYNNSEFSVEIEELALFGDMTLHIGDSLEVSAGGRFYRTSSSGVAIRSGLQTVVTHFTVEQRNEVEVKESGFNPKLSLVWHLSDDALSYASAAKGFRIGGVQSGFDSFLSASPAPDTVESDSLWSYEIGLRTEWLDNTLQMDVTAFYAIWEDAQTIQSDGATFTTYLDNVGGVKTEGVEAALLYLFPIDGLSINISAAYTDAVTTEDFLASDGYNALAGTDWPSAPHLQTATTLAYQPEVDRWKLGIALTHTYLGKALNDLGQRIYMFDYQQWDLNFSAERPDLRWLPEVSFSVSNLLDERGIVNNYQVTQLATSTVLDNVNYLRPRAFILRLTGRF